MGLDLAMAERIVKGSIAKAEQMGVRLSIAVVDEAGNLVHLSRMDGAIFLSPQIAMGKAFISAAWRTSSGEIEKRAQSSPPFFGAVSAMTGGRAIPRQGALPITIDGRCVGAVGASGGSSQEDEDAVRAGIEALG
jgi:glc operon protein GlcG